MTPADESLGKALSDLERRDREIGLRAEREADLYRQSLSQVDVPYVFPDPSLTQKIHRMPFHHSAWKTFIHLPIFSPIRKRWHVLLQTRRGA